MRKLCLAFVFASALPFGVSGHVSAAASSQANCTGQYASTYAGPQFGPFAASYAVAFKGLHLGGSSSTNDCSGYPPPYTPAP